MDYDDLEKQVRDALHAEAEAGPDYATVLHMRIMARVVAAAHAPAPAQPPTSRRRQMMMMAAMVIGIALLAFIVFHLMH